MFIHSNSVYSFILQVTTPSTAQRSNIRPTVESTQAWTPTRTAATPATPNTPFPTTWWALSKSTKPRECDEPFLVLLIIKWPKLSVINYAMARKQNGQQPFISLTFSVLYPKKNSLLTNLRQIIVIYTFFSIFQEIFPKIVFENISVKTKKTF